MDTPEKAPSVSCPSCRTTLLVSVERYPLDGGTYPCPACGVPILLVPRAAMLVAGRGGDETPLRRTVVEPLPLPAAVGSSTRWKIAIPGVGVEEVDHGELRNRIYRGELTGDTEVARQGSESWVRASGVPELARWLASSAKPAAVGAAPPGGREETVTSRALAGLSYPASGDGLYVLGALAVLAAVPFLDLLVGPATAVWTLAILRESAHGERVMPSGSGDRFDFPGLIDAAWKTTVVSVASLSPVLVWALWSLRTWGAAFVTKPAFLTGLAATGAISLIYYPASLATVAIWGEAVPALHPGHVVRVIRTMGGDYLEGVIIAAVGVAAGLWGGNLVDGVVRSVPFIGRVPGTIVSTWSIFWAAHVFGWAVHRHLDELGWRA